MMDRVKKALVSLIIGPQRTQRAYYTFEEFRSPKSQSEVVAEFHKLYYDSGVFEKTWKDTLWLGVPIWKCPMDLWIYQEIIFKLQPDFLIETGTAKGGSALYIASLCDLIGKGKVITIDIHREDNLPQHRRISYLTGSSISPEVVDRVKKALTPEAKVMVILDSDHSKNHVSTELEIYSKLVSDGSYLIVEDTNINGHPVDVNYGPGPMEAVEGFLLSNKDFSADSTKEKFYMTFNPKGYLVKNTRLSSQTTQLNSQEEHS
jgi:cephalosporin hydroxylase